MIKQECMYCNAHLGWIEEEGIDSVQISHGLCPICLLVFVAGTGTPYADFLDVFQVPLFVVGADCEVINVNKQGRRLVAAGLLELQRRPAGEVFECTHARPPEECGETVHCKSCTIRKSVLVTATTGKPFIKIPAHLDLDADTGQKSVRFLISTERIGMVVLLRIEDAVDLTAEG